MNHRERFQAALSHQQPDRVPLDVGGAIVTSLSAPTYPALVKALGLGPRPTRIRDLYAQTCQMDEDVLERLGVDTRPLDCRPSASYQLQQWRENGFHYFVDEWGITARIPEGGSASWYSTVGHPLAQAETVQEVEKFRWPEGGDKTRFSGLAEQARRLAEEQRVGVVLETNMGGVFEWPQWLRGTERFMLDLFTSPDLARAVMEKVCDFKCAWWAAALEQAGPYVDLIRESDDLGSQSGLLVSAELYREFIKPLHQRITATIRKHTRAKIALHCCGAIRPIIPDLIESGFDVLNPVQVGAAGMDPAGLKKEFGRELVFWGGACDSQKTLPFATPEKVKEEARRNLEALMPGGGYVFASINLLQSDIPAENVLAMAEVLHEFGRY